jgi:2-polyprenyl-3-methyl-5-hydroxy-6-metoxy-1,4-benzoquinol methylase
MSIDYYNKNGEAYFRETVAADVHELRRRFLFYLNPGASILDAGCGSGRDAAAFAKSGFTVTAFDASWTMVRLATAHAGITVHQLEFDQVRWENDFDGVWASASLLHVPRERLPGALNKLVAALRPGGVLFASFKYGTADRQLGDRSFTDMTENTLEQLFASAGLDATEIWISKDVRPERAQELWVNGISKRSGIS